LETKIGDVEGMIYIFIPYITIEPTYRKWVFSSSSNLELTNRVEIPIRLTAEILRREFPLNEILKWDIETIILPLRPLVPDYCYLRLGDRRVWQCKILPDYKCFPKRITIEKYAEKPFGTEDNMDTINPLVADALSGAWMQISVELGRTSKTVKEVFGIGEGTILELDTLNEDPLEVKANGVLFARGEVVVIDENFGVRITEIIGTPDVSAQSKTQQPTPEPPEPSVGEAATEPNAETIDKVFGESFKEAIEKVIKKSTDEEST
jgi:flagellar motor switch protein FliN